MRVGIALAAAALAACGDNTAGDDRLGGDTSVEDRTVEAFTHPAANLDEDGLSLFRAGRGPFNFQWVPPQLGPLFNNNSCAGCHGNNGRGQSLLAHDNLVGSQSLVRVSLATGMPNAPGGPVPVPGFGLQLQDHNTSGLPEIVATLTWTDQAMQYADGEVVMMRTPTIDIRTPMGDYLPSGTLTSYRQAPPLIGLGLLDAIDEGTLSALEDPDDADGDGISGRLNHVWDSEAGTTVIGRFGWKANAPSLRAQVAGAFVNDMGLTNKVFPESDGTRDVEDHQLDETIALTSTIAVPLAAPRDAAAWHGRTLFEDFGCGGCHTSTLVTGASTTAALAHQTIHPYTDLLLHDMGDLLTDSRPDFAAQGREWRTPPLWGLGLAQLVQSTVTFMHDGRARTLAEAILWHGGEAMATREAFRTASKSNRDALIAFLMTL
ncbi:MAG: putative thiol oxidoreductase [Myxococcales bacterium]|nr:putative thiol oxidoreductase [Myxococcales bacterium]